MQVEGDKAAKLLVACTSLGAPLPPALLHALLRELGREGGKKLPRTDADLLADLVCAIAQLIPYSSNQPASAPAPLMAAMGAPVEPAPVAASAAFSSGAGGPAAAAAAAPSRASSTRIWADLHTAALRVLAQPKGTPGSSLPCGNMTSQDLPASSNRGGSGMGEHWVAYSPSGNRAGNRVSPVDVARLAWGFARGGYHEPSLFSALEAWLMPGHSSAPRVAPALLGGAAEPDQQAPTQAQQQPQQQAQTKQQVQTRAHVQDARMPKSAQALASLAWAFAQAGQLRAGLAAACASAFCDAVGSSTAAAAAAGSTPQGPAAVRVALAGPSAMLLLAVEESGPGLSRALVADAWQAVLACTRTSNLRSVGIFVGVAAVLEG